MANGNTSIVADSFTKLHSSTTNTKLVFTFMENRQASCFFSLGIRDLWRLRPINVHTKPEEFENGGGTLKTHQIFSILNSPEKFNNNQRSFRIYVWEKLGQVNEMITVTPSFTKGFLLKMFPLGVFRPRENEKQAFSNSSRLKSVFAKLLFHDGLEWTVGLTVELKLRFEITSA